jgi:hypothetical protein
MKQTIVLLILVWMCCLAPSAMGDDAGGLAYSIGYDSILHANVGLGLYACDRYGSEGSLGVGLISKFGLGAFCVDLDGMYLLGGPDWFGPNGWMASSPVGFSVGLSYLYSSEKGLVYREPIRGIGLSGKLYMGFGTLSLGFYNEIENEARDYFYRIGLGVGF